MPKRPISSLPVCSDDAVSDGDVERFQRDGAVILRGLLSARELASLREAIDWNMANPGPLAGVASADDDPGQFFEDFCNWSRVPAYERLAFDSALPSVAARLMRSRTVRLYHDHLLVKEPMTRQPTPWHQDQPYYNISGLQTVSFWIPVDPVPRESTLELIAGSHDGTWYMPRTFLTEQAKWFPDGTLSDVPDPAASGQHILSWDLEVGDAVAFHMLTVHGSQGSTERRRVFSLRMIGDDVRHAPRPWRTSPQFDGLAEELPDGAEMDHPSFPLVFPPGPP
jgi:ectoine hydroxylase-related dioxygenase (phytanoyl-CoA dioxygenase family)